MKEMLRKSKFDTFRRNAVIDAPSDFPEFPVRPDDEPSVSTVLDGAMDWIMVFVMNSAELAEKVPRVMGALAPGGIVWLAFPKKRSNIKTDLDRDHGWDVLQTLNVRYLNLISINETWSGFAITHGSAELEEKRSQKSEARTDLLAQYMNHETREMWYPEDMQAMLDAHPTEKAFFLGLSFTNRKEYLEWVVSAKRPETRAERLAKIPGYLASGRKNPAGR